MSEELKAKYAKAWDLGEREAQKAFDWIVEDTEPSAIPTSPEGVADLVDAITPDAMDRLNLMLEQAVTGPTAFPKDMFVAIEEAFRLRFAHLLTDRAASMT
jgi:hypothetical protein